ncbi:MAG: phenylalanine 4-monooxygenase [Bdellovibrionaceae bacterium]|nr:phenylalanine 4-monooxygenase [Pseudobdellovibrionaceae bacterium]
MEKLKREIPDYLRQYVVDQDYELYSPMDQASWRYIMRVSKNFYKDYAHEKYIDGLKQTGITIDSIPRIHEMDEKLKQLGWRAVSITGFIPPAVFLEFLSLSLLPIACDIRRPGNVEYTPSPDIVHEAAGHAPIIADPDYARYLHKFGEIARNAIFSKEDFDVYLCVKRLSDIKEDPSSTEQEIAEAQRLLDEANAKVSYVSEATKLSRLGWWSIEYGLFKKQDDYLIYGAGLLSSVSEGYNAIHANVPRRLLDVSAVEVDFDITKPQPQLFYTEDFQHLETIIDELADSMAYRRGGIYGMNVAKKARTRNTLVLDSGLQISGVVERMIEDDNQIVFFKLSGPSQLSFNDKQLTGHGPKHHPQGYSTPMGPLKSGGLLSKLSEKELVAEGLVIGNSVELEFASGIQLVGTLTGILPAPQGSEHRQLVFTFENCKVFSESEVFFEPDWGVFDLACGTEVVSVFGGAADRGAYRHETGEFEVAMKPQTSNVTSEDQPLVPLYALVREVREQSSVEDRLGELEEVYHRLKADFPKDWLLRLELLELVYGVSTELSAQLRQDLEGLQGQGDPLKTLIQRGLEIIG